MVKVLVDTSVWIAYFRQEAPCHAMVGQLLEKDGICCLGIILAELLQGVREGREAEALRDFPQVFEFLAEDRGNWIQAGLLSNRLRRQGCTVGLADCYIAVTAQANGVPVLTLDGHFQILSDVSGVKLVPVDR